MIGRAVAAILDVLAVGLMSDRDYALWRRYVRRYRRLDVSR